MKWPSYLKTRRSGYILAAVGAVMLVSLVVPFWFWWLIIGIGFLCGGFYLLRR
ncbi:MAG: hypothetical protein FWD99_03930 [Oscillospiraceae bacterium]|nr:hypothetical protein [Oscillospiraceae bacterium]